MMMTQLPLSDNNAITMVMLIYNIADVHGLLNEKKLIFGEKK